MTTDAISLDAKKVERKLTVREVVDARTFLDKYGVDVSTLSDAEAVEKHENILNISIEKIQVLSRGQVLSNMERLLSFVPKGMVGQFFRETPGDIHAAQAMGWEILFDDRAKMESSTGAADGKVRLGDQLIMMMPEDQFVALRYAEEKQKEHLRNARKPKHIAKAETSGFAQPVNVGFDES